MPKPRPLTHILHHRLDPRRGDDRAASVAFCGFDAPDVAPLVLFPDRHPELVRQGMGGLIADVRPFAPEGEATCTDCCALRLDARPSFLRRLWRKMTGTAPELEPAPDLLAEPRHPEDDGAA